jgi:hypothetical protein
MVQTSARTPPVLVPASNALASQILARDETDPKPGPPRTLILFEENPASSEQHALKAQTSGTFNEKGERLDSHRNRARLLNRTIPNSVIANVRTRTPVKIKNLTRLVFWGHGAPNNFCGFTPAHFAELLKKWKEENPTLQAVDMPTCNVRHYESRDRDTELGVAFTDALKPELDKRGLIAVGGLTIRTVPQAARGAKDTMSKLFWDEPTGTWVYATGPTEMTKDPKTGAMGTDFARAEFLLKPGPTKQAEYRQRPGFKEGLAWRAERAIADKELPEGASFAYGTTDKLMDLLVPLWPRPTHPLPAPPQPTQALSAPPRPTQPLPPDDFQPLARPKPAPRRVQMPEEEFQPLARPKPPPRRARIGDRQ